MNDMRTLEKYRVRFYNGGSRQHPGKACDYMICWVEDEDSNSIELYAEALEPDGSAVADMVAWDYAIFNDLKAEIIDQAERLGVAAEQLEF